MDFQIPQFQIQCPYVPGSKQLVSSAKAKELSRPQRKIHTQIYFDAVISFNTIICNQKFRKW